MRFHQWLDLALVGAWIVIGTATCLVIAMVADGPWAWTANTVISLAIGGIVVAGIVEMRRPW